MADKKESKVETAKRQSNQLRGTIEQTLVSDAVCFDHDDIQALKFHGVYQQDDRDRRAGRDKHYMFMIRTKTPGGRMTAEQYLAMDDLARRYTWNNSLRITTRQAFQFHGIIKKELRQTIKEMNDALVSTLAACGDVERNVMASPAPIDSPAHRLNRHLADEIAAKLAPATGAYHEIWSDGEKQVRHEQPTDNEEPFYGEVYLPRKFKTGVALPEDNSVDVFTQDCGLVPIIRDGQIARVNVLVGGGLGMTHRKADTFARLGSPLGSVAPEDAADAVKIVVSIFRDHGNRADRRHARLKYLIEEWGMEKFKAEFVDRAEFALSEWIDPGPMQLRDYLGRNEQGDGKFFYGVWVENGRVIDTPQARPKTAFRRIAAELKPTVILTPGQSILFADMTADQIEQLQAILKEHNVRALDTIKGVRRYSMACPALPTCGLALAESERSFPSVVDEIERALADLGLEDEPITLRMTGCPNGCARPYTADIAFVGRKPEVYDVYVGGRLAGDRLAVLYAEQVKQSEIVAKLSPLFKSWAADRLPDETLGDFFDRLYTDGRPRTILTGSKEDQAYLKVVES